MLASLLRSVLGAPPRQVSMAGVLEHGAGELVDHQPAIPDVLIFTYRIDLLSVSNVELDDTDLLLRNNVLRTINMHNSSGKVRVKFYDDDACEDLLHYHAPGLVPYFLHEERGAYKGDICRGAALVATGGLYFDVDMETRVDARTLIGRATRFVSPAVVHKCSQAALFGCPGAGNKSFPVSAKIDGFFQSFIGVAPNHPIMRDYLEQMLAWYEADQPSLNQRRLEKDERPRAVVLHDPEEYRCDPELLGVCMLARSAAKVGEEKRQIWWELKSNDLPTKELQLSVGKQAGVGDGCNYLVFDPVARVVPFWSREDDAARPTSRTCSFSRTE
jgi:hypothetical protein